MVEKQLMKREVFLDTADHFRQAGFVSLLQN
jgi:hypothetical protein